MPPNPRPSTPNDQEMIDPAHSASPLASPRQSLPTSLASFALAHASSASAPSSPSSPSMLIDDGYPFPHNLASYPLYRKLRRSSLLSLRGMQKADPQPVGFSPRSSSPVNTVFPSWKDHAGSPLVGPFSNDDDPGKANDDDNQQQRDGASADPIMALDDPPSALSSRNDADRLSTPPRLGSAFAPSSSSSTLPIDMPRKPLKLPRLLTLLSEATPQEAEVDSEAKFQRLLASHAELPVAFHPRTPRSARGRFPEEVGDDDEDEKFGGDFSDEDDGLLGGPSAEGSVMDDFRWMSASPAGVGMDVDMQNSYSSPSAISSAMMSGTSTPHATAPHSSGSTSNNGGSQNGGYAWRDTPPAGMTSGRASKRKHTLDDRFEPYGHPSKRRAVSPSVANSSHHHHGYHFHHHNNSSTSSPISIPSHISHSHSLNIVPRSPVGPPISPFQPGSGPSSRSVHSSPILRPVHRLPGREREREERERAKQVNGAGDGVKKINLGS